MISFNFQVDEVNRHATHQIQMNRNTENLAPASAVERTSSGTMQGWNTKIEHAWKCGKHWRFEFWPTDFVHPLAKESNFLIRNYSSFIAPPGQVLRTRPQTYSTIPCLFPCYVSPEFIDAPRLLIWSLSSKQQHQRPRRSRCSVAGFSPCATTISLAGKLHKCRPTIHGKNTFFQDKESKNNKNKNNVERLSQEQKSEVLAAVPRIQAWDIAWQSDISSAQSSWDALIIGQHITYHKII